MAKKRSNGEGSITKRSNGSWRGILMTGYNDDGSAKRVSFSGATRADVLAMIREYRNRIDAKIVDAKELTLAQWADTWYSGYRTEVLPSTYCNYKYTLKLIKEGLGALRVQSIIPININSFLDSLAERGYSMSQIHKCRTMLIQIFNAAEANNLVLRNPAQRSKLLKAKESSSQPCAKDAFTEAEIALLEKELPDDLLGNSIRLMLCTGLRTQELLALTKEDIAADGSWLSVSKAIKTVDGLPVLGPPKNKTSYRRIPIPEGKRVYALYLRENSAQSSIWSAPGKKPCYAVGSFRRRYYTALEKLPVRKLSPHSCRHTYVTQLEAKGVPMEVIARLAGHSEIRTTNNYLHTSPATLQDAVAVLDERKAQ